MECIELKILKNKIFELLNGAINLNEFENWLYTNQFVNENVIENAVVSEFLEINLRSNGWFYVIQKFAKNKLNTLTILPKIANWQNFAKFKSHWLRTR